MMKKNRLLALMITIVMLFSLVPAMSFAEDGGEPSTDWAFEKSTLHIDYLGQPITLEPAIINAPNDLTYQWYVKMYDDATWNQELIIDGATGRTLENAMSTTTYGRCYILYATDTNGVTKSCRIWVAIPYVDKGAIIYGAENDNNCYALIYEEASGDITIMSSVKFRDGKTRKVDLIRNDGYDQTTSCTIPATVKDIETVGLSYVGSEYDYDAGKFYEYKVKPGYVIYGTKGSYAEKYAKKYGIKFRDPAYEKKVADSKKKEAARQGTRDKAIPKVKILKPVAAKKAINVRWKKLTKKQLRKSKATRYEIWVCPDGKFAAKNTVMKTVKKTKASYKVTKLKKGKTYRVKVRAIRYVKGKKRVGAWSAVKKVKVK